MKDSKFVVLIPKLLEESESKRMTFKIEQPPSGHVKDSISKYQKAFCKENESNWVPKLKHFRLFENVPTINV